MCPDCGGVLYARCLMDDFEGIRTCRDCNVTVYPDPPEPSEVQLNLPFE